jgi:SpoVK/Ycf46/Vps4 family AAA+-type ATPase
MQEETEIIKQEKEECISKITEEDEQLTSILERKQQLQNEILKNSPHIEDRLEAISKLFYSDNITEMFQVHNFIFEQLISILAPKAPLSFQKIKNVLLYGPPGCGKTSLVRSLQNIFQRYTFIQIFPSTLETKILAQSIQLVHELFQYAKRHQPSIIFFDDCESLFSNSYEENETNNIQIFIELQNEINKNMINNSDIFILVSSNVPFHFDPSMISCFQSHIFIDFPTEEDRIKYIKQFLQKDGFSLAETIEISCEIAKKTKGFSYRDLNSLYITAKQECNLSNSSMQESFIIVFDFILGSLDNDLMKQYELFRALYHFE